MMTPSRDLLVFLAAVLRRPGVVGAVVPSSRDLGELLATVVPRDGRPTVVELGPGTGAVSTMISRRLPPGGRRGQRPALVAVRCGPAATGPGTGVPGTRTGRGFQHLRLSACRAAGRSP